VFLFFKEALANIARHSNAKHVDLSLSHAASFTELVVADDGRGFDLATVNRGLGLDSLRERARAVGGSCVVDSAPDCGTRITLRVPLSSN